MTRDYIGFWADVSPDKVAIVDATTQQTYSYGYISSRAEHLAGHLYQHYGVRHGDRVAVVAPNCIGYIILFAAAQKSGFTLVPLNYRLTRHEVGRLLQQLQPIIKMVHPLMVDMVDSGAEWLDLTSLLREAEESSGDYPRVEISDDDPLFVLYTSGSSGRPKGAIYSHKMLLWNSINTQISLDIHTETTTLVCMPPFHTGGWNVLLTPVLHSGGTCLLLQKFYATKVLQLLEHHRCTIFMAVPTMLKMMYDDRTFEQADLSSLLYIIVGGESMALPLIEAYHAKGVPIRQGYGMTEVGPNLTSLHQRDAMRKIGSIGKPNMYVETRIVSRDGTEVADGQQGELWLSGPNVTPGYITDDGGVTIDMTDGWFRTGDVVIRDEEGFLYIVDRIKNMYISGGENVYPAEVERVLSQHPAIEQIVVVAVADDKWGETGKAFVVLYPGQTLDLKMLRSYGSKRLSKYKLPRYLVIVDQLPLTTSGKVDRKRLVE